MIIMYINTTQETRWLKSLFFNILKFLKLKCISILFPLITDSTNSSMCLHLAAGEKVWSEMEINSDMFNNWQESWFLFTISFGHPNGTFFLLVQTSKLIISWALRGVIYSVVIWGHYENNEPLKTHQEVL